MKCDEGKVTDIISQITRLYQDLVEIKAQLEEKVKIVSALTGRYTETNISNINFNQEESLQKLKLLISQIETIKTAALTINKMDISSEVSIAATPIQNTSSERFSFEFNTITEEETLNAIEENLNRNRKITDLVNSEINKQLKELQK